MFNDHAEERRGSEDRSHTTWKRISVMSTSITQAKWGEELDAKYQGHGLRVRYESVVISGGELDRHEESLSIGRVHI